MNLHCPSQRWSFVEENLCCVYGEINAALFVFTFLIHYQTLNLDLYYFQLLQNAYEIFFETSHPRQWKTFEFIKITIVMMAKEKHGKHKKFDRKTYIFK